MPMESGVQRTSAPAAGAALAAQDAHACRAEQAIFTSIRSPMGEGYRLVAMSPGITAEERAEITRRSPSHDSICNSSPTAAALASYTLSTQRQCVAWTRYAGREHTARGGQRVHTHLVVLEPEGFVAFACDPFRVQAALLAKIGDQPNIKPSNCLVPLDLEVGAGIPDTVDRDVLEQACTLARAALDDGAVLAIGADEPLGVTRWMIAVLPLAYRPGLCLSANLQYAPARQLRLTCVDHDGPELRRAIQGHAIRLLNLRTAEAPTNVMLETWLSLVVERRRQGRLGELCALADELRAPLEVAWLDGIVAVCHEADRLAEASQCDLETLVTRYGDLQPRHAAEGRLIRQLLSNAVRRASELQPHVVSTANT